LIGEFDKPDPEAVARAVKFHLFIGFGAEARQLLQAFPVNLDDAEIWQSLSFIIDGEEHLPNRFVDLSACDSATALWAAMSKRTLSPDLNKQAVLLAFSGLPSHLRQLLGPELARRFLEGDDKESARAVRDSILRAPGSDAPSVELLQAEMHMQSGDPQAAETELKAILADPGPNATDALIGYVEARYAQALPIEADVVPALEAIVQEQSDTETRPKALRALSLAQASSGDFAGAFATADSLPQMKQDVWKVLATLGIDDAILEHAIIAPDASYPSLEPQTAEALARRLLDLGFPTESDEWLNTLATPTPILAAQVALAKGNPRGTLTWLAGNSDPESEQIRALALQELGDYAAASDVLAKSGAEDLAMKASLLGRDWSAYPDTSPDLWNAATKYVTTTTSGDDMGPLARSQGIVETSAATRVAVSNLMNTLPNP
jgi:tetratricopeptide (TPR) repeat protein